ncbi:MAG: HAD hydrolase family protein [Candidatus Cloacimonetes bacterium]|nr:HAD hydrolase family protein [Candidatus Cloacimonadota bacterium]
MKDLTKIKLLVCDCDGVLTEGLIVYDSQYSESKNFSAHDGLGVKMLHFSDVQIAVITGRYSKMLERRCDDLQIKYLYQNVLNKKKVLQELLSDMGLSFDNVAYIGDDWNDFLAMQECQLKIAPKNARDNFKMTVDMVTENEGGYGAVRDAIEFILKKQQKFETVLQAFLEHLNS